MNWISIKETEAPFDVPILVKYFDGMAFCVVSKENNINNNEYILIEVPGVSGYEWEVDFKYEDITDWIEVKE